MIYQGEAFNGKPTKTARSHGKKFQVSIKQETSRLLVFYLKQTFLFYLLFNFLLSTFDFLRSYLCFWTVAYFNIVIVQGNLGWAYMQKMNYMMAEVVYRKAQMIDPDCNKAYNLGLCLVKQAKYEEAQLILEAVLKGNLPGSDDSKSRKRAQDLLKELRSMLPPPQLSDLLGLDDEFIKGLERLVNEWGPIRSKRLPIFEEISSFRDQLAC